MKLNRTSNINVINIELAPKTSAKGAQYYKTFIQCVPTTNTKLTDILMKLYEQTPTAIYQRPTEMTDDDTTAFEADLDCGV
jgi:hypothetical protein